MDTLTGATFDMGRAWDEGMARVRANLSLLAILAGVFFFLPAAILYLAMPQLMDLLMTPGGDPEALSRAIEAALPQFLGGALIAMLVSFVGYGAMIALMGDRGRLSVGEAIAVGFRSLLPLIGVLVVSMIAYMVIAIVVGVVIGLLVAVLGKMSAGLGYGLAVLIALALFVAVILAVVRLSLTLPVVVLERVANPFAALKRSWAMTGPVQWRLLGFYILFFIAYMVVAMVALMVMGLLTAAFGSPAVLGFLNGLVGAAVAVVFSGLLVGIYRQLAGSRAEPAAL